ncbi:unnamed protein product [Allacma fusca]|uniref:Uncharacterized protein n=1 Tax=Allacma fusca TaxID=39272 RepID=A0A8J2JRM2_9HEXA|nr:unnamed protein product [Allacma fusca]
MQFQVLGVQGFSHIVGTYLHPKNSLAEKYSEMLSQIIIHRIRLFHQPHLQDQQPQLPNNEKEYERDLYVHIEIEVNNEPLSPESVTHEDNELEMDVSNGEGNETVEDMNDSMNYEDQEKQILEREKDLLVTKKALEAALCDKLLRVEGSTVKLTTYKYFGANLGTSY